MSYLVSISVPYEGPMEESFSTLEEVKTYVQGLSPMAYEWSLDNITIIEIAREVDIYKLLLGDL